MDLYERRGLIGLNRDLQHLIPFDAAWREKMLLTDFKVPPNGSPPSVIKARHNPGASRYTFWQTEEDYHALVGNPTDRYEILLDEDKATGHLHVIRELGGVVIPPLLKQQVKSLSSPFFVSDLHKDDLDRFNKVFGYFIDHMTTKSE